MIIIVVGITEVYNNMKFYIGNRGNAEFMWLASAGAYYSSDGTRVDYGGRVDGGYIVSKYGGGGVCPVVSLTSAILVENVEGEIKVQ